MKLGTIRRNTHAGAQGGYVLLFVMLAAALFALALTSEATNIVGQVKRDREVELVHRGAEYARAIKKFYRKFGRYPVSLEQLENTNQMRFLRKRYKDPVTGKDFRVLRFGDVKLTPKTPGAATNPGVGVDTGQQPNSPFQPVGGTPGGSTGPTFGGGPIIGVASTSTAKSMMEFNGKSTYNGWEFIYEPTTDRGGLIRGPYEGNKAWGTQTVPGQPIVPNLPGNPLGQSPPPNQR